MYEKLKEENFIIYCAKRYDNPNVLSTEEFLEDLDRIKYIKKLITRYTDTGELKERLILNHIMTLNNCFGEYTTKILYLKLHKQFNYIKPFLLFLNILPLKIFAVADNEVIDTDYIPMDQNIIDKLRALSNDNRK
jgi:hypothetical protein